jgi:hypothetical protein
MEGWMLTLELDVAVQHYCIEERRRGALRRRSGCSLEELTTNGYLQVAEIGTERMIVCR